jgi:Kinesin motor domain
VEKFVLIFVLVQHKHDISVNRQLITVHQTVACYSMGRHLIYYEGHGLFVYCASIFLRVANVRLVVNLNDFITSGAGKTYTMLGKDDDPGIMARALTELFTEMKRTQNDLVYKVTMSYLEVLRQRLRSVLFTMCIL